MYSLFLHKEKEAVERFLIVENAGFPLERGKFLTSKKRV
jgi:hypothetical protein